MSSSPETHSLCFHFQHHHSLTFHNIKILCLNMWHFKFTLLPHKHTTHGQKLSSLSSQPTPRPSSSSSPRLSFSTPPLPAEVHFGRSARTAPRSVSTHSRMQFHTNTQTMPNCLSKAPTLAINIDECCCVPIFASLLSQTSINSVTFPLNLNNKFSMPLLLYRLFGC